MTYSASGECHLRFSFTCPECLQIRRERGNSDLYEPRVLLDSEPCRQCALHLPPAIHLLVDLELPAIFGFEGETDEVHDIAVPLVRLDLSDLLPGYAPVVLENGRRAMQAVAAERQLLVRDRQDTQVPPIGPIEPVSGNEATYPVGQPHALALIPLSADQA